MGTNFVIANPKAGAGKVKRRQVRYFELLGDAFGSLEVRWTEYSGHATELAREACEGDAERLIVVGGDGTCNEALNGCFDEVGSPLANIEFVPIPAGTGSDFGRSIGYKDTRAVDVLSDTSVRIVDVGRAVFSRQDIRYFLNVASAGSSGEIVNRVNSAPKRLGAKPSFIYGTLRGLFGYQNQKVRVRVDAHFDETMLVNVVAVGNGRYFGGGMMITPKACLDDGLLELCILGDIGVATFVKNSSRVYAGTHGSLDKVHMLQGKKISIELLSTGPLLVETDGEQPGVAPVVFEAIPKALKLRARWSCAEAI